MKWFRGNSVDENEITFYEATRPYYKPNAKITFAAVVSSEDEARFFCENHKRGRVLGEFAAWLVVQNFNGEFKFPQDVKVVKLYDKYVTSVSRRVVYPEVYTDFLYMFDPDDTVMFENFPAAVENCGLGINYIRVYQDENIIHNKYALWGCILGKTAIEYCSSIDEPACISQEDCMVLRSLEKAGIDVRTLDNLCYAYNSEASKCNATIHNVGEFFAWVKKLTPNADGMASSPYFDMGGFVNLTLDRVMSFTNDPVRITAYMRAAASLCFTSLENRISFVRFADDGLAWRFRDNY